MARVDTIVLFLILEEMLSVFNIENNVCCGFFIYGIYYVEVGSLYAHFLESYHKWVLNAGEGVERKEPSCTVGGNVN